MFEGLTIVIRALMIFGLPVLIGCLWAEILDMFDIWKEEHQDGSKD